jgi:plasmid replication initiation protein
MDKKPHTISGKEWIEKLNALNEICPNTLKLQQYRFFCIYLAKINARDKESRVVRFSIEEFQGIMELGRINMGHMKETTDKLLSQIVHIPRDDGGYRSFQLFKLCEVGKDKFGRGYVEINAHDEALPLMFDLKEKYFKYRLENVLMLKSVNQIRLYELLKAKEHIGAVLIVPLDLLKEQLGIGKKQYPRWNNFRARVIEPCRTALEKYTDICFTYAPIKKVNKITAVQFEVYTVQAPETVPEMKIYSYQDPKAKYYGRALRCEFAEEAVILLATFVAKSLTSLSSLDNPYVSEHDEEIYGYLERAYAKFSHNRSNNKIDHPIAYIKKLIELDIKGEFEEI